MLLKFLRLFLNALSILDLSLGGAQLTYDLIFMLWLSKKRSFYRFNCATFGYHGLPVHQITFPFFYVYPLDI